MGSGSARVLRPTPTERVRDSAKGSGLGVPGVGALRGEQVAHLRSQIAQHTNVAAALSNDAVDGRETEPGTPMRGLRREEDPSEIARKTSCGSEMREDARITGMARVEPSAHALQRLPWSSPPVLNELGTALGSWGRVDPSGEPPGNGTRHGKSGKSGESKEESNE